MTLRPLCFVFHSRLEHNARDGSSYFLTWMLHGSLPVARIADRYTADGAKFLAVDHLLDARSTGPLWLERPDIADAVASVLLKGQVDGHYDLSAWVVMPNHAHVLLRPLDGLGSSVARIKGASARAANALLGRAGSPFWAKDYFDHRVRDSNEEQRIIRYIESNPVRAGLCGASEGWQWSSARYARFR